MTVPGFMAPNSLNYKTAYLLELVEVLHNETVIGELYQTNAGICASYRNLLTSFQSETVRCVLLCLPSLV